MLQENNTKPELSNKKSPGFPLEQDLFIIHSSKQFSTEYLAS